MTTGGVPSSEALKRLDPEETCVHVSLRDRAKEGQVIVLQVYVRGVLTTLSSALGLTL